MTAPHLQTSAPVDLGLPVPVGFSLQALLPDDRLLRLHPNWFISDFHQQGDTFSAAIKDYVTEEKFPLAGSFVFSGQEDELLSITLNRTIEIGIRFFVQNGSLHVAISSASGDLEPDDPLLLWIRAIREYIRIYVRKTPVTLLFRQIMNRMVLQMDPSQRKICLLLARITFVEILVILFIVIGYVIFVL